MPTLTATEQAKLLAYRQKQALPAHTSPALTTSQNAKTTQKDEIPDLISWCVEDIVGKLEGVESYFQKAQNEKDNFKSFLYSDFLSGIANNLTSDLLKMSKNSDNYYGLNSLLETDNPKEFFGNLTTIISFVPDLADNFIEYTTAIYLGLCTKFYLLADSQILSLSKTLS